MVKKKNRGNGARSKRCQMCNRKSHPFKQNAAEIEGWLNRMEMFVNKGLALSRTLDGRILNEQDDLFWALVKYIENIQECVIKLDDMNCSILRALAEIPIKSETGVDLNWRGIKLDFAQKLDKLQEQGKLAGPSSKKAKQCSPCPTRLYPYSIPSPRCFATRPGGKPKSC